MYHLRFKGNHYDIGVKRGKIFKKCNIIFPLNMDNFQMNHGIESEKILQKYFKEVCEEIKGEFPNIKSLRCRICATEKREAEVSSRTYDTSAFCVKRRL